MRIPTELGSICTKFVESRVDVPNSSQMPCYSLSRGLLGRQSEVSELTLCCFSPRGAVWVDTIIEMETEIKASQKKNQKIEVVPSDEELDSPHDSRTKLPVRPGLPA
jgi:hypothetical protein